MATKKKKITKTTKKPAAKTTHKKAATRTKCKKGSAAITNRERYHLYAVLGLSIIAGILLCADAAIMAIA